MSDGERSEGLLGLLDRLEGEKADKTQMTINFQRYLDYHARKRGIPLRGSFELTPLCNLDCKMCYVHLTESQMRQCGKKILTGAQWKEIMQQAIDHGMMYTTLTGGEAMLHPDFDDIYLFLQERGIGVSVNSNGLLLTDERIDFFKKHSPLALRVTLYGSDDDVYEQVTGKRVFARIVRQVRRAHDEGLRISLNLTPNRYMRGRGGELLQLAESLKIPYLINSFISEPREETGRNHQEHDITLDEYIQLFLQKMKFQGNEPHPFQESDLPEAGGGHTGMVKGFRCSGGKSAFAVLWNGRMQSCFSFDKVQADALNAPFSQAWKTIHDAVSQYPLPIECEGCSYQNVCPICPALHAEGAPPGHANPALCKRAKRLLVAGLGRLENEEC